MERVNDTRAPTASCILVTALLLCACDAERSAGQAPPHAPRGFAPTSSVEREGDRVARCNTVHSLTLPNAVVERYETRVDEEAAILSCSLQIDQGGTMQNVAADASGNATLLTGRTMPLEFREILDQGAVSYIAPFSIEAKSAIDFSVSLVDRETGKTYNVQLRQAELPGRR